METNPVDAHLYYENSYAIELSLKATSENQKKKKYMKKHRAYLVESFSCLIHSIYMFYHLSLY